MATYTPPVPPTTLTVITVAWATLYVVDNVIHLRDLLPDPGAAGKVHVSTGAITAGWVNQAPDSALLEGLDVDDLLGEFLDSAVSAGTIDMWAASNASIPATWLNYDALLNRVPLGANHLVAYGGQGGSLSHVHAGPNHQHTGPNHNHTGPNHNHGMDHDHGNTDPSADDTFKSGSTSSAAGSSHVHHVNNAGGNTDDAGTGATGDAGTGATGFAGTSNTTTTTWDGAAGAVVGQFLAYTPFTAVTFKVKV